MLEIDLPVSRPVKTGFFLEGEQGDSPPVLRLKVADQGEPSSLVPPFGAYESPDERFCLIRGDVILIVKAVRTFMVF